MRRRIAMTTRTPGLHRQALRNSALGTLHSSLLLLFSTVPLSANDLRTTIEPLLSEHCYDYHDDVTAKAGIETDSFATSTGTMRGLEFA